MNRRTRIFFFTTLGILVLGLTAGAVASYMGGLQRLVRVGSDGPSELAYVPGDAVMLAYADVRSVMSSELRQKLRRFQGMPNSDAQGQFEASTGVNIERDVDHVVIFGAHMPTDALPAPPTVILHGRFDAVRIEGLLRDQGATVEEYQDTRLLNHAAVNLGVAFAEPDLLVVGPPASVRKALDAHRSRANVRDNTELMRLVREVDDGTAWAIARFDEMAAQAPWPPALASNLPALDWVAISGRIDDGLHGIVRVEARDEAAATDLREVVRGFLALARLQTNGHAAFAEAIDSLQLSGEGTVVVLAFSVPSTVLDAMGSMRPPGAGRMPQPPGPPEP